MVIREAQGRREHKGGLSAGPGARRALGKDSIPAESHASPLFPASDRPALNPKSVPRCVAMNQFRSVPDLRTPLSPALCHQRAPGLLRFSCTNLRMQAACSHRVGQQGCRFRDSLLQCPATLTFLQAPLDANQGHGDAFSPVQGGVGGAAWDCSGRLSVSGRFQGRAASSPRLHRLVQHRAHLVQQEFQKRRDGGPLSRRTRTHRACGAGGGHASSSRLSGARSLRAQKRSLVTPPRSGEARGVGALRQAGFFGEKQQKVALPI